MESINCYCMNSRLLKFSSTKYFTIVSVVNFKFDQQYAMQMCWNSLEMLQLFWGSVLFFTPKKLCNSNTFSDFHIVVQLYEFKISDMYFWKCTCNMEKLSYNGQWKNQLCLLITFFGVDRQRIRAEWIVRYTKIKES